MKIPVLRAAACAALLAACAGPNPPVGPVALQAGLSPGPGGEVVSLKVTNLGPTRLQYGTCGPQLERQGPQNTWVPVAMDELPCPLSLEFLDAWGSRRADVALPANLPAGTYRIRFPQLGALAGQPETFVAADQLGGTFNQP